jgi:hypothetical protein
MRGFRSSGADVISEKRNIVAQRSGDRVEDVGLIPDLLQDHPGLVA